MSAFLLLAAVEFVTAGKPVLKVQPDSAAPSQAAAAVLRRYVTLMTGAAPATGGGGPALRITTTNRSGYSLYEDGRDVVIEGSDPVRAVYDLLESWGYRPATGEVPQRKDLRIEAHTWRPARTLWIEADTFDPSIPSAGVAVAGLEKIPNLVRFGYSVRAASESFDDFLPPARFKEHPEWFALRGGERSARGNFALTNPEARAAYIEAVGSWLQAHPHVAVLGIFPEVTSVWCEESLKLGAPEAYALLWRACARRFPERRFEILATGLTLRPPAGTVPDNVDVRLRPGRDASGLQPLSGQPIEAVVKAWEVRGANVVFEIDAAPTAWCGMPWPCETALRGNAERFRFAVLRHGSHQHARIWRDPATAGGDPALLARARTVRSWGDPADAADLFFDERYGMAFRIGATERLHRLALKEHDAAAANDVYANHVEILAALSPPHRKTYRRMRRRAIARLFRELLPDGATRRVGPAEIVETPREVTVETDRLRLVIRSDRAVVTSFQRRVGDEWSANPCSGAFEVVALKLRSDRCDGEVRLSSPREGRLRIDLSGALRPGGPRWRSRLDLSSGSVVVRQTAEVKVAGGIAVGCVFEDGAVDRWICPAHAREGRIDERGTAPGLPLPPDTLVYCRKGEFGLGLAARLKHGGTVTVGAGLVATRPGKTLMLDWVLFMHPGELAK